MPEVMTQLGMRCNMQFACRRAIQTIYSLRGRIILHGMEAQIPQPITQK